MTKKAANEDGYIIRIPLDPWQPIQVFENGHVVVSHLNVNDYTVMDYFRRGIVKRQDALFNSPDRVISHPMMRVEKADRVEVFEDEKDYGGLWPVK